MPNRPVPFVQQFAQWSFENDRDLGCFNGDSDETGEAVKVFDQLDSDEKVAYLDDARSYIEGVPVKGWPSYVLDRFVEIRQGRAAKIRQDVAAAFKSS